VSVLVVVVAIVLRRRPHPLFSFPRRRPSFSDTRWSDGEMEVVAKAVTPSFGRCPRLLNLPEDSGTLQPKK
jgi:hypothetical protein